MLATFTNSNWLPGGWREFLRRELAPTPGRWHATLRITLSCVICTIPIMVFHLREPLLVMLLMFLVVREDTTTTTLGTVLGILGATIGCGLLLLYYMCLLDLAWLRVLAVPGFIAAGLFINRVVTLGPVGSTIGLVMALGMVIPDTVSATEYLNRFPFYFWWATVLGLGVNLGVEQMLNPQTHRSVMQRGLMARLEAVETLLRRLATAEKAGPVESILQEFSCHGTVQQLQLLKVAEVADPWLKQNHAVLRAHILLVDRLVTAAALLEFEVTGPPNEGLRRRLLRVADACAAWEQALRRQRPLEHSGLPGENPAGPVEPGAMPSLAEMERVLELLPQTFAGGGALPEELQPGPVADKGGVLVPDAFTNPEYVKFAIKGGLSAFICYLVFTLADYPGLSTSVITCIVCALSTIGASLQRGMLRFLGALIGGLFGLITLVWIFPNVDSLGGFWLPFAAVTGLAAYVNFGGPRISYCGYQIAVAFYKCVLQNYGPVTELTVVRDRLLGIALGLAAFGMVNAWLWPVRALELVPGRLAAALRALAKLARLPNRVAACAPELAEAGELRLRVYQDFEAMHQLLENAKFEPGAARREQLEAARHPAQRLLLYLTAVIQHRRELPASVVPERLRTAALEFRNLLAGAIDRFAARVAGQPEPPLPDLPAALRELEGVVAREIQEVTDAGVIAEIRARLTLYRKIIPIVLEMERRTLLP